MGPNARSQERFAFREGSVCLVASAVVIEVAAEYPGGLGNSELEFDVLPPLVKSRLHRLRFLGGCEVIFRALVLFL